MYYLNSFLLYSLFGFVMESTLFKIVSPSRISGVLYGPITLVYGLGGIAILLMEKYILSKIKINKMLKIILTIILLAAVLTVIECISGNLCKLIFNKDMWNYTNKKYNMGRYICLEYVGIWGLLGTFILYILKPILDKIIKLIPKEATLFFYLVLSIDFIITIITK